MKPAVPVVLALALAGCVTPVASGPLGEFRGHNTN